MLRELWDKLNDHSTAARIARFDSEQFFRNIQDLNFFLIRRSPFLTESEKDLARLYLESIYAFRVKVEKSRDRAAYEALITSRQLDEVGDLMGALAYGNMVQDLEDKLASHIKDALVGKAPDIDVARIRSELLNEKVIVPEDVLNNSSGEAGTTATERARLPQSRTREQNQSPDDDWL